MKVRENFVVRVGGNEYTDTPNLLACKGEPVLTIRREPKSGELDIYDEKGREKAVVRNAKLVKGNKDAFDIRVTENSYTVFDNKAERAVCEIRRRANARDMDLDVSLLLHTPEGFLVHANPDQTNLRTRQAEGVLSGRDAALSVS